MVRAISDFAERGAGASAAEAAAGTPPAQAITTLDRVPLATAFVIHEVVYPEDGRGWNQRLEELGFLPGERVLVLTRPRRGGDPLAVRVGHSTFALRRVEAACVRVRPWPTAAVKS
jgi:ferrous iron transport protein A